MLLKPFWLRTLDAGRHGLQAWRLWEAQGGMYASLRGLPESRLALAAKEHAERCRAMAGLYAELDALFPLGLTGPMRAVC